MITDDREADVRDRRRAAVRSRGEALALLKATPSLDAEMVAERANRTDPRTAARVLYAAQQAEARAAAMKASGTACKSESKRASKADKS